MPDLAQHVRYYQWFIVTELGITASALTLACALATHAFIPHHHTGTEPLLAATPGTNHRDTEPGTGPPAAIQEGSDSKQSSRAPPSLLDFGHDATPQWGEGAGFHHTPTQPHAFCPQPRGSSTPTAPAAPNTRSSQGCADLGSDP